MSVMASVLDVQNDVCSRLLAAQLPEGAEPVFEVVGPGNLAVSDGLNVDRHDPEALATMGHAEEIARRCSRHLTAYDDALPGDEDFLDLELHVGDGFGKASDHFDRGIASPAFAGQIAPARLVVRGEDVFLERLHIALDGLVEQAVPGGDHRARLGLGQTLGRDGQGSGQHGGGGDESSEPLHGVPPHSVKLPPNIGRPLLDSAWEASSWRTSQCSTRTPSTMRRMSAAIQLFGRPCPEKRPWTITKSPSATITPCSYLSVGGALLIRLKRPSRPGSICALCWM